MDRNKILITGINDTTIEIHVINSLNNQYVNKFFVLGDMDKMIGKIRIISEIYDSKDFILDEKSLSSAIIKEMREKGLIVGVV